ncbi:MAG: glycerol-3-phosphate 1-O-acyltransferase PlsY [Phycisphaerales bacterium]|nr:glycerol-3-phosphate 1-O-acyltransferase PlsY [Phycisphaerales bacterium]
MMWLAYAIGAYLLGSVPFGLLIGKARGIDIREHGSGNIGATNLGRVLGKRFFFLCFFLDLSKGLAPTLLAGSMMGTLGRFTIEPSDAWGWLLVMVCAVFGHLFSPWLGFRGGKGVATALGALLGMFPAMTAPGVGALVVFLVVLALWRYISLASCMAAITLPFWTWFIFAQFQTRQMIRWRDHPQWANLPTEELQQAVPFAGTPFVIVAAALAGLVIYKHRTNLSRLMHGTEPTVGSKHARIGTLSSEENPSENGGSGQERVIEPADGQTPKE